MRLKQMIVARGIDLDLPLEDLSVEISCRCWVAGRDFNVTYSDGLTCSSPPPFNGSVLRESARYTALGVGRLVRENHDAGRERFALDEF
jgi:hypothetical protein